MAIISAKVLFSPIREIDIDSDGSSNKRTSCIPGVSNRGEIKESRGLMETNANISDLIARIISSKTALESSDLHYLEEAKTIREYIFKSDCCDLETRIVSALKNYYSNIPSDISYGNRYLILALADPRYQLMMKEIPLLTELVENLQPYGEVTVDFGIKEGLGKDVEISIIRSK